MTRKTMGLAMGVAVLAAGLALAWRPALTLVQRPGYAASRARPAPPAPLTWPWLPGGALTPKPHFTGTAFSVTTVMDNTLPKGQESLVKAGTQGITFVGPNNRPVTIAAPKPAVVAQGTAITHSLTVNGKTYQYIRVISMIATAYNASYAMNGPWGGVSAWTGQPLHYGDVAVDPSVIPLGTHLYIPGYGPALADDTGSAIVGDHVDLFFNESSAKISRFGVQHVKVYVLAGP